MFDIIIKDGKKESYIKLNGNKLEGFNALNGVVTPLTIEEVNSINLLKLSDDKSYLGSVNDYDIYVDNISGLKHYFKDGKEDFEATWAHNGEDALVYKGGKLDKNKDEVKKISLDKGKIVVIVYTVYMSLVLGNVIFKNYEAILDNIKSQSSQEQETVAYNLEYGDNVSLTINTDEILENVTLEQIESYIEENDDLTEEEKEIYCNKKLLQDVVPYYENTNMNVLIPLRFDGLQTEYYYEEPDENGELTAAYFDPLIPNRIFVNTYYNENCGYDRNIIFYDVKAHENVHHLQPEYEYRYIVESSAEVISKEYYEKCINNAYLDSVKNLKILMEIVGPEPIWKLNFSGDDTDLLNIIKTNFSEGQANVLISLLKEKPGKDQKEGLDEDITFLLSQLYTNMYGEDMRTNPFIDSLLGNGTMYNRYYFNSDLIEKEAPYTEETIYTLPPNYTFWYACVISNNYDSIIQEDIFRKDSEDLFMLSKNNIELNTLKDLTKDVIEENEITFYYHGEIITLENIDLSKYENVSVMWQGGINPEVQEEVRRTYYSTIYESFPEQRIGSNGFTK